MSTGWDTLVQAETLAAALDDDDLVILDCRFALADADAGEQAWRQSHIPGALYAHLDRDLSGARTVRDAHAGRGRHPWPEAADFTATLGAWGIRAQHQVVAYDDGDGAFAARLWFLLRALGHARVAVLDGGWARWSALGLPRDAALRKVLPATYHGHFDAQRLLDALAMQAHLDSGGVLLDARAGARFRGEVEPIDAKGGHVPGARNRPYADNLHHGRFKPAAQLAQEFAAVLGRRTPDEVAAMCGSGVTACHHLLAMEHAGLRGAKLFTGSWSGWIEDPARPVAVGGE